MMSNVDNAFVGRYSGTAALAALAPGGVLSNNLLFLFAAILNSATTGLVSRAWKGGEGNDPQGRAAAALSRTMSIAWVVGFGLTAFYALLTPWAIAAMGTPGDVLHGAVLYARIKGMVSWASITCGVCLSALLATRDSMTPLKVILSAQAVNFLGDFLLCCWPLRTGVAGAAAATACSTLVQFCLMLRALGGRSLLPNVRLPTRQDVAPVAEYAGPLFVITAARIVGFTAMSFTAASLGTVPLAAYQVVISIFVVFVFVGGPMSQNAQTVMPPLVDSGDTKAARRTFANILLIANVVALITSAVYFLVVTFGAGNFTTDANVVHEVVNSAFSSFLGAATLLVLGSVDGTMTASRDFGLIVVYQLLAVAVQLLLLAEVKRRHLGLPFIFMTFTVRLWICAAGVAFCLFTGLGRLGRVLSLRSFWRRQEVSAATVSS